MVKRFIFVARLETTNETAWSQIDITFLILPLTSFITFIHSLMYFELRPR